MDRFRIHTECHADTLVTARILGIPHVTHQPTNAHVLQALKKISGRAIGIIDNDKQKPGGFRDFEQLKARHKLCLLQKPETSTYLITISPAIEGWLLYCAEQADIDPDQYGFCNQKRLRQVCKNVNASKNQRLLDFINTIKQKNPPPITLYAQWIRAAFK